MLNLIRLQDDSLYNVINVVPLKDYTEEERQILKYRTREESFLIKHGDQLLIAQPVETISWENFEDIQK